MHDSDLHALFERIRQGDRFALSRGITLVESTLASDQLTANKLLVRAHRAGKQAFRIAVSGAPGVGKSTFIEHLGIHLLKMGSKVAVLTIDPSSPQTRGSILGDKTRMGSLGKQANAYIRPSPSAGLYGGIGLYTYESSLLCELAGYDIILVETVGVGQSEIEARHIADLFVVLVQPGSGDELQGMKRGILEKADCLIVTKHDGDLQSAAKNTRLDYLGTWQQKQHAFEDIFLSSIRDPQSFQTIGSELMTFLNEVDLEANKRKREVFWFYQKVKSEVVHRFLHNHRQEMDRLSMQIKDGETFYLTALEEILKHPKSQ